MNSTNKVTFYNRSRHFSRCKFNKEMDDIIDTLLPEELRSDLELDSLFDNIQSKYDSLFIDNDNEFKYVGFENENDKIAFIKECDNAIKKLMERCKGRYHIINRIKI